MSTNVIKKYKNRKLYFDRRYIGLPEVINLIINGQDVQVVDHDNKDVTIDVLKQAYITLDLSQDEIEQAIIRHHKGE